MNPKPYLPYIRHALQLLAGVLIAKGWLTEDESGKTVDLLMEIAGPAIMLGSMVWMHRTRPATASVPIPVVFLTGIVALGLGTGCARFTTRQQDISYDTNGTPTRAVSTRASAYTFWEADSKLSQFKALQTDKTQSASVGSLDQSAGSTNTVAALHAIVQILNTLK